MAWDRSEADSWYRRHEVGGVIVVDDSTGNVRIVDAAGARTTVTPLELPALRPGERVLAEYHTHPNPNLYEFGSFPNPYPDRYDAGLLPDPYGRTDGLKSNEMNDQDVERAKLLNRPMIVQARDEVWVLDPSRDDAPRRFDNYNQYAEETYRAEHVDTAPPWHGQETWVVDGSVEGSSVTEAPAGDGGTFGPAGAHGPFTSLDSDGATFGPGSTPAAADAETSTMAADEPRAHEAAHVDDPGESPQVSNRLTTRHDEWGIPPASEPVLGAGLSRPSEPPSAVAEPGSARGLEENWGVPNVANPDLGAPTPDVPTLDPIADHPQVREAAEDTDFDGTNSRDEGDDGDDTSPTADDPNGREHPDRPDDPGHRADARTPAPRTPPDDPGPEGQGATGGGTGPTDPPTSEPPRRSGAADDDPDDGNHARDGDGGGDSDHPDPDPTTDPSSHEQIVDAWRRAEHLPNDQYRRRFVGAVEQFDRNDGHVAGHSAKDLVDLPDYRPETSATDKSGGVRSELVDARARERARNDLIRASVLDAMARPSVPPATPGSPDGLLQDALGAARAAVARTGVAARGSIILEPDNGLHVSPTPPDPGAPPDPHTIAEYVVHPDPERTVPSDAEMRRAQDEGVVVVVETPYGTWILPPPHPTDARDLFPVAVTDGLGEHQLSGWQYERRGADVVHFVPGPALDGLGPVSIPLHRVELNERFELQEHLPDELREALARGRQEDGPGGTIDQPVVQRGVDQGTEAAWLHAEEHLSDQVGVVVVNDRTGEVRVVEATSTDGPPAVPPDPSLAPGERVAAEYIVRPDPSAAADGPSGVDLWQARVNGRALYIDTPLGRFTFAHDRLSFSRAASPMDPAGTHRRPGIDDWEIDLREVDLAARVDLGDLLPPHHRAELTAGSQSQPSDTPDVQGVVHQAMSKAAQSPRPTRGLTVFDADTGRVRTHVDQLTTPRRVTMPDPPLGTGERVISEVRVGLTSEGFGPSAADLWQAQQRGVPTTFITGDGGFDFDPSTGSLRHTSHRGSAGDWEISLRGVTFDATFDLSDHLPPPHRPAGADGTPVVPSSSLDPHNELPPVETLEGFDDHTRVVVVRAMDAADAAVGRDGQPHGGLAIRNVFTGEVHIVETRLASDAPPPGEERVILEFRFEPSTAEGMRGPSADELQRARDQNRPLVLETPIGRYDFDPSSGRMSYTPETWGTETRNMWGHFQPWTIDLSPVHFGDGFVLGDHLPPYHPRPENFTWTTSAELAERFRPYMTFHQEVTHRLPGDGGPPQPGQDELSVEDAISKIVEDEIKAARRRISEPSSMEGFHVMLNDATGEVRVVSYEGSGPGQTRLPSPDSRMRSGEDPVGEYRVSTDPFAAVEGPRMQDLFDARTAQCRSILDTPLGRFVYDPDTGIVRFDHRHPDLDDFEVRVREEDLRPGVTFRDVLARELPGQDHIRQSDAIARHNASEGPSAQAIRTPHGAPPGDVVDEVHRDHYRDRYRGRERELLDTADYRTGEIDADDNTLGSWERRSELEAVRHRESALDGLSQASDPTSASTIPTHFRGLIADARGDASHRFTESGEPAACFVVLKPDQKFGISPTSEDPGELPDPVVAEYRVDHNPSARAPGAEELTRSRQKDRVFILETAIGRWIFHPRGSLRFVPEPSPGKHLDGILGDWSLDLSQTELSTKFNLQEHLPAELRQATSGGAHQRGDGVDQPEPGGGTARDRGSEDDDDGDGAAGASSPPDPTPTDPLLPPGGGRAGDAGEARDDTGAPTDDGAAHDDGPPARGGPEEDGDGGLSSSGGPRPTNRTEPTARHDVRPFRPDTDAIAASERHQPVDPVTLRDAPDVDPHRFPADLNRRSTSDEPAPAATDPVAPGPHSGDLVTAGISARAADAGGHGTPGPGIPDTPHRDAGPTGHAGTGNGTGESGRSGRRHPDAGRHGNDEPEGPAPRRAGDNRLGPPNDPPDSDNPPRSAAGDDDGDPDDGQRHGDDADEPDVVDGEVVDAVDARVDGIRMVEDDVIEGEVLDAEVVDDPLLEQIRDVNPYGGDTNCADCAIVTALRLEGLPDYVAVPGPMRLSDFDGAGAFHLPHIEEHFSSTFESVDRLAGLERWLLDPDVRGTASGRHGPHGILTIKRVHPHAGRTLNLVDGDRTVVERGPIVNQGHVINVVTDGDHVRYFDGQTGREITEQMAQFRAYQDHPDYNPGAIEIHFLRADGRFTGIPEGADGIARVTRVDPADASHTGDRDVPRVLEGGTPPAPPSEPSDTNPGTRTDARRDDAAAGAGGGDPGDGQRHGDDADESGAADRTEPAYAGPNTSGYRSYVGAVTRLLDEGTPFARFWNPERGAFDNDTWADAPPEIRRDFLQQVENIRAREQSSPGTGSQPYEVRFFPAGTPRYGSARTHLGSNTIYVRDDIGPVESLQAVVREGTVGPHGEVPATFGPDVTDLPVPLPECVVDDVTRTMLRQANWGRLRASAGEPPGAGDRSPTRPDDAPDQDNRPRDDDSRGPDDDPGPGGGGTPVPRPGPRHPTDPTSTRPPTAGDGDAEGPAGHQAPIVETGGQVDRPASGEGGDVPPRDGRDDGDSDDRPDSTAPPTSGEASPAP